jgi:O-antigen/teichoic acid export membrane protein
MMLVQKLMRAPDMLARFKVRVGIEGGVFAVSTLSLLALGLLLHFFPTALGRNVAEAAPLVVLALFVPGLRNLVEYQAELLFGRGQMLLRAMNLALLAGVKAALLGWLLMRVAETTDLVLSLNWVFAALYLVSALATYTVLRRPAKPV